MAIQITDPTYYERGSIYIPNNKNVTVEPEGTPTVITELEFFIEEYERNLLLGAIGVVNYEALQVALADLNAADPKWKLLVEGETYVNGNGITKRWDGLQGWEKRSVLAYFVYTEYLRNYNETFATTGTVKNDSKNATNISATPKFIKAYNQFLEAYQGASSGDYPTVVVNGFGSVGYDWYGQEKPKVSLYQYLLDKNEEDETSFPDLEFKFYTLQNSFGI